MTHLDRLDLGLFAESKREQVKREAEEEALDALSKLGEPTPIVSGKSWDEFHTLREMYVAGMISLTTFMQEMGLEPITNHKSMLATQNRRN